MKTPILETERLILRPISLGDAPALQKHFNNWNIVKYTAASWPLPDDSTETQIRDQVLPAMEAGTHLGWTLVLKGEGEVIGRIDYRLHNDPADRGFWLAEPYHRRGLMTEAITATQDFVFFEQGLDFFRVTNTQSNIGSRKVKEKCGAVFVKLDSKPCGRLDEPTEVWEVTRENWTKIRGKSID